MMFRYLGYLFVIVSSNVDESFDLILHANHVYLLNCVRLSNFLNILE